MTKIKAIFFDQDGVIIDTERDGHRVAFNKTFKQFGFNFEWGVEEYQDLLKIGGGKERMKYYLNTKGFGREVPPEEVEDLIMKLHHKKTEIFIELIESNSLPLRPGIHRFMKEAVNLGLTLGICTTSNERAADAIAFGMLADIPFSFVLAGDIVTNKKPDPEIYHLALSKTGLSAEECAVIEDSRNGVLAAKAAGMHVIATTNHYTENEDLEGADIIVTCLGDKTGEIGKLTRSSREFPYEGILKVADILDYFNY